MDFDIHKATLDELRHRNRKLELIIGAQAAGVLLALIIIFSLVGAEKTIVTPPVIERTFWVTKDKASREYLEQMGGFIGWLVLDVAPQTIDWKKKVLLNYVAPDEHASMQTRMDIEADRLRRINGSTSFLIQQLTASEQDQSVVLTGRLRRQINGQDTGEPETRSYLAQFQYVGGRVHVKAFKEIPYGPNAQARIGAADISGRASR